MSAIHWEEFRKLPLEERLRLAEELWESMRAEYDALPITESQREELDRRLAVYRADPSAAEDADAVFERIRRQV